MKLPPLPFVLAALAGACGSSSSTPEPATDTGTGGDTTLSDTAVTDSPGSDTKPGTDAPGTDAPVADSGGGPCGVDSTCSPGLTCCGTTCINKANDPLNCGGCGTRCSGSTSMCLGGTCVAPSCAPACKDGQTCCDPMGPGPSGPPKCFDGPTCPVGCPACG